MSNKKLFWFTPEQTELFDEIKKTTGFNGAVVIREGLKCMADNLGIAYDNIDAVKPGGTPTARTRKAKLNTPEPTQGSNNDTGDKL